MACRWVRACTGPLVRSNQRVGSPFAMASVILLVLALSGCAVSRSEYRPDMGVASVIPRDVALAHLKSVGFDVDE